MKDFIEKIEKIGFKEVIKNIRYKYGHWTIDINWLLDNFIDWQLTYSDLNPDITKRVETTHLSIHFDDSIILKKYFKQELRELSLNKLGI